MKNKLHNRIINNILPVLVGVSLMSLSGVLAAKEVAGKTILVKGKVKAFEGNTAIERRLRRRSPIYGTDLVKTDTNSKTQLRMTDGGMIALKENSELLISNYQYNAVDKTGNVVMELVKGGLRSVTGAIKSKKGGYQLKTPVGSIGIRGTHYEIEIIQGEVFIAVWDGA
ncbi:MAG: FecR family protein, partial [Colwellia sp.]